MYRHKRAGAALPPLLDRVCGDGDGASAHHLKVFASRLRTKLERPGSPLLIVTERGVGYRFVRPRGCHQ